MERRIADAFVRGLILPPDPQTPDLVHLTRALGRLAGVQRFEASSPAVERVLDCIGEPEHLVFVLLDGLGSNLLERLPPNAFLAQNLRLELRATSPSTTASALTSVATGTWPSEHAVTGWHTHLPARGLTATTLHVAERFSGEALAKRGISLEELLPVPAFHAEMSATPLTLLPAAISDTPYARYSRGGTAVAAYEDLNGAIERIVEFVSSSPNKTFCHLYVPDVDTACHHYGLEDARVTALVRGLDGALQGLASRLPRSAKLVISADHGLIDVPAQGHLPLLAGDPLMTLLEAPPSGDGRMPIFHVRPGCAAEFERAFHQQFGEGFALLSRHDYEALGLFGPGPMSDAARRRFGDFVGIALAPVLLHFAAHASPRPEHRYVAQHAGLTPQELLIPLIVA